MANRPKGYGMTAELKEKQDNKYDTGTERKAQEWLEGVVREPFPKGTFHEALKDGIYLCKAINVLRPGSVNKINTSKMAFKQMENICSFLTAAEEYGLSKMDSFQTVDLYEEANMVQVVNSIHSLGRAARKNGFSGPVLGPKESAKRTGLHDPKAGQAVIGLQMGSNRGASQAGMTPYGLQRQVEKTNLKT